MGLSIELVKIFTFLGAEDSEEEDDFLFLSYSSHFHLSTIADSYLNQGYDSQDNEE